VPLIIVFGIAISVRVSGLLLIAYFGLAVFFWWLSGIKNMHVSKEQWLKGVYLFLFVVLIAFISYFSTTLFWPYASENVWGPLKILPLLTKFEIFNSYEIYFGKWYNSWENPWHYGFVWTFITLPLTYFIGIFLYPLLFCKKNPFGENTFTLIAIGLIFFACLFPPVYVIIKKSVIYNEARHLLFIVPPFAVLTALGFERLFNILHRTSFYYLSILIFILFTFEPARWMWKNHPLEGMYFSPLTGGIKGAFKRFEFDYWSVSTKPALEWIANNTGATADAPVRLKMFYGESIKVTHYINRYYPNLVFIPGNGLDNWDYQIQFTVASKFDSTLLFNWPPKGTVHEIKADGVPVAAIIKNPFKEQISELGERMKKASTANQFINIGLEYYGLGDYHRTIQATRKAVAIEPENVIAWNNLCSAYNNLKMFEMAIKAGKEAIRIKPDFELAQRNLEQSIIGLTELDKKPRTARDYLNLSYYLYIQDDYSESLAMCFEALRLEPDNALAYNNICSLYNVMGQYEKGKEACEKALKLKPDFVLAQNNLNESLKGIESQKNKSK
jgi:tetratricopeptide (TPR) repeat protein